MPEQPLFDQGMFWAALGMAWVFGFAVVVIVVWNLRSKRKIERLKLVHEERLRAMEKGLAPPELPDLGGGLGDALRPPPNWALALGLVLIAAGLGVIVAFIISGTDLAELWSLGFIGIFVGVGLVLFHVLTRPASG